MSHLYGSGRKSGATPGASYSKAKNKKGGEKGE